MAKSGNSVSFISSFQSEKVYLHPAGKEKSQTVRGTDFGDKVPVLKMRMAPWRARVDQ